MNYKFDLYVAGAIRKGIFQSPPMTEATMAKIIHCHRYAEIHIVLEGEGRFVLENETHPFSRGSAFLIPPGVYHCYKTPCRRLSCLPFRPTYRQRSFFGARSLWGSSMR